MRPIGEAPKEELLELAGTQRAPDVEPTLALDDLIQVARQHVVLVATDVREVVTLEERLRRNEGRTTVSVSEGLGLRDPVSEKRSSLDDPLRRGCVYSTDFV